MNSVGIDVSKGKSTVCVKRVGEEVLSPFEINHTASELSELAKLLKSLDGEIRVVMEATGNYHLPIVSTLHSAGVFVSVVKRGSPALRRTLFLIMTAILIRSPADEPVYQFMDKKRSEGKPYKVYMMASANKFLRIYYASVKSYLDSLEA